MKKFIVSGGGTGGHIYPAIAIADEIKRREPDAEILFVGANGRMEMEKVPKAGYPIEGLSISGLPRKISLDLIKFPFKVAFSILKARKIVKNFKPDMVIGTGGYASAPTLHAASGLGIPTLLQEQNSFPGKTNKSLARKASAICVAYSGLDKIFNSDKVIETGNPIRAEIFQQLPSKKEALEFFGLPEGKKTILSIGGSLGSRNLNKAWEEQIEEIKTASDVQLIWQTGSSDYMGLIQKEKLKSDSIKILEFIYEMRMAYAAADVIVSRAGAIAISELCLVGKPVILLPLPWAAEDHQTKNAEALVKENAAIMIKDPEANQKLVPTVLELLHNDSKMSNLAQNISQLAKPNATKDIVDIILNCK